MTRIERTLTVLLVLLLVVVLIFVALLLFAPERAPQQQPVGQVGIEPTSTLTGQTAHRAYANARAVATEWQADAMLATASATWPQGLTRDELAKGEAVWTFTFYSPAAQEVATINVANGIGTLASNQPAGSSLDLLEVNGWQVDSSEAIQSVLGNGGDAFMSNAGFVTLNMNLSLANTNSRVEWLVALFSNQEGTALTHRIDATSGETLEVLGSP